MLGLESKIWQHHNHEQHGRCEDDTRVSAQGLPVVAQIGNQQQCAAQYDDDLGRAVSVETQRAEDQCGENVAWISITIKQVEVQKPGVKRRA